MYIGNNRLLIKILDNVNFIVPTTDMTCCLELIEKGIYDVALTNFFGRNIKDNMTLVDIGANIGYFTILFSGYLTGTGKVYSFEPNEKCYNNIIENIRMHNLGITTKCFNIGIAENKTQKDFFLCNVNGNSSLINQSEYIYKLTQEVPNKIKINCDRLDNILDEPIDYIKIDVEGGEYYSFLGFEKLFKKKYIKNIITEWNPYMLEKETKSDLKRIINENFKYKLFINPDGTLKNYGDDILNIDNKLINILLTN